jgi:alanyl-tRNA synthetase
MVNRQMLKGYPELEGRHDQISLIVKSEEEKFINTLEQGERVLEETITKTGEKKLISGEEAFILYDTYGLPIEVVKEVAKEKGVEVDEEGFNKAMESQKMLAREGSSLEGEIFRGAGSKEVYVHFPKTKFTGYDSASAGAKILGMVKEGKSVKSISQGETAEIVLDRTPFYAESGGQAGDTGDISSKDFSFSVGNTFKIEGIYIHRGCVGKGKAAVKQKVDAQVDCARRAKISIHHTATHLLHFALRKILGAHVTQAGSYVGPERLRFDFHHYKALSPRELNKVETFINEKIRENSSVEIREMALSRAKEEGAMALFGEKYGEKVRVVKTGSYSRELCGGIHTTSTGRLGLFIILGERAISAGLRRIEAAAGEEALLELKKGRDILAGLRDTLKVKDEILVERVEGILQQNKKQQKEINKRRMEEGESNLDKLIKEAAILGEAKLIRHKFKDYSMENLRETADRLKKKLANGIGALVSVKDGKVSLVIFVAPSLINKFKANEIIKELGTILGGGGGGRPDLAQAGGKDASKVEEVFQKLEKMVRKTI